MQGSIASYLLGRNKNLIKLLARNKPLLASNCEKVKRPALKKVSIYTYFLSALEMLILAFRWSEVITAMVYLRGWSEVITAIVYLRSWSEVITAMVYLRSWRISAHMVTLFILCFSLPVWNAVILDLGKTDLFHTKKSQVYKEIVVDISIFLRLFCFIMILKKLPIFVITLFVITVDFLYKCFLKLWSWIV